MENSWSMKVSETQEKNDDEEKNIFQRRNWLVKNRRKRKKRNKIVLQHHDNCSSESIVRSRPPLWWSSTNLICHLNSRHNFNKTCTKTKWKWSKTVSTTILMNDNEHILFHPRVSSSTQVVLADSPLPLSGNYFWEIYVPAVYGTSIMFGIASKQNRFISRTYYSKENILFPSSQ